MLGSQTSKCPLENDHLLSAPTNDYSSVQNSVERLFWAGNQGNHQNFEKSLLSYKCRLIFIGMKLWYICPDLFWTGSIWPFSNCIGKQEVKRANGKISHVATIGWSSHLYFIINYGLLGMKCEITRLSPNSKLPT